MTADQSAARAALEQMMDAGSDRVTEIALLTVLALAKGWQTYTDRKVSTRAGRRATDLDCQRMINSQAKLEHQVEELTTTVLTLTAEIRALEASRGHTAPP